ncbi:MAG: tetratricopeptide repeat protein, partial [Ferruginibacter sp.]
VLFIAFFCMANAHSQQMSDAETKALALANEGKLQEAATAFEAIYNADIKNIKALNTLIQLYGDLGNSQKAYQYCLKGYSKNHDDKDWNYQKAELETKIGKPEEAITTADNFLAKHPDVASLYFIKGDALDAQSKIQLAIGAYSKAIKINPQYVNALFRRAKDFAGISRYQNAIDDFTEVLKVAPSEDEVYNRRGLAFYSLDKMDKAAADFSKAIELNPKNNLAFANRGWVYFNNESYSNAIADFERSNAIKPYDDALFGLASVYNKQKKYTSSIAFAQKAIAMNDKMAPYYTIYASALAASDRSSEALAAAEKILILDADNADGYILKATALSNLAKYDEGIKTITTGIQKYPENYLMYGLRSYIYKQQGKTSLADADTQKAKELSTKN